jgi:trehalose 6-phosphate phosphatase
VSRQSSALASTRPRPSASGAIRRILAKRHQPTLAAFAWSNVLVAFDYDGTLAPIVANPQQAKMRRKTRRLLTAVARRYPCVVISGRSRRDVSRCVGNIPIWHLSGNHGLEPWGQNVVDLVQVREWVETLRRRLNGCSGITIEDKSYSVTVHYRHAPQKARARRAIEGAVRTLRGARALGGKHAVSLVPRGAPNKGTALERARRLLACDTAIYVGDDETDEEAFAAASPDRLLAIRIGFRGGSKARYHLSNQQEIDALLEALLAYRPDRRGGVREFRVAVV